MKSIGSKVSKGLPIGARIIAADNAGAREIKVISVKGFKTNRRKLAGAGVADLITASVINGSPDMRHKVVQAVIVRQKMEFNRPDGTKVKFEDNAAILLKDVRLGMPKGTLIKGPIAKEVAARWPQVAKIASQVL